jgi:hypothetical protein
MGMASEVHLRLETLRGLMEESLRPLSPSDGTAGDSRSASDRSPRRTPGHGAEVRASEVRRLEGERSQAHPRRVRGSGLNSGRKATSLSALLGPTTAAARGFFLGRSGVFGSDWSAQRLRVTEELAGERYTPEVNVELPHRLLAGGARALQALLRPLRGDSTRRCVQGGKGGCARARTQG